MTVVALVLGALTWWVAFRLLQIEEEYALPPVREFSFYWWERLVMTAILNAGLIFWPVYCLIVLGGLIP